MESFLGRSTPRFLFVVFLYSMLSLGYSVSNQIEPSSIIRIPGDLNILAVLNYRESVDGFRCTGEYNHRVAYDVEALRFAAESAAVIYFENLGINLTLGLTVIDGCNSPVGTLRDVSYALSDTAMDLNQAGPAVGILVPGTEDDGVSELVFEEISRRLGILTIGYLPSLAEIDINDETDSPLEETNDAEAQMDENMEGGMTTGVPMLTSAVPLTSETSVLASILKEKSWFNVGLFYSGYGTGPSSRITFLNAAGDVGACVSFERNIPYGLTQEMADEFVSELFSSEEDIRVLVWMVSPEEIRLLLRSISLRGNRFSNVGTSAWKTAIDNGLLDDGLLREANGTIFIDDVTCDVNENFRTYISMLDVNASVEDNPWLNRTIIDGSVSEEDSLASHTSSLIRAVEMIARYINQTFELACRDNTSINQDCVLDFLASPNAPLLETVEQTIQNEEEITKTYCVLTLNPPGTNMTGDVTPGTAGSVNLENLPGQNGTFRSDDCLCFISGLEDRTGSSSDVLWLYDFGDPWIPAIFAVSLVFGLFALIMLFVLLFFWRYPVSRKSAIVANVILLLGIMMMYIMNIFYTRFPNELICGFQQFGTAFIHAWVFAALLVKCIATFATLEPDEDLDTLQPKQRSNRVGPFVQLCAFMAFLAPQAALSVQWIVLTPPRVERDYSTCGIDAFDCNVSHQKIVISMVYVFVLVSLTLIFSLARIKDGRLMQESRSLFLSSVSSILLMIAWMVCFILADPIYQTPAICVGVTANATVILLSCFGPTCCVITYGDGAKAPDEEDKIDAEGENEDRGDDIAYVNPVYVSPTAMVNDEASDSDTKL